MSFRTITVFLDETPASEARLEAAIGFASAHGAHLDAVALLAEPAFTYVAGSEMALDLWAAELRERRKVAMGIADAAAEKIAKAGLSAGARADAAVPAALAELAAIHARASDVAITGVPDGEDEVPSEVLDGVLFGSGRPAIAMPSGAPAPRTDTVLAGWDAGEAATRAIHEALPVLKSAANVSLTVVDPHPSRGDFGEEPGADIAAHLARHGVRVTVERLPSLDRSTAETVLQHAEDIGAGMIVMGGYGHSKLRERLFGGVTREMLMTSRIPMFMAH